MSEMKTKKLFLCIGIRRKIVVNKMVTKDVCNYKYVIVKSLPSQAFILMKNTELYQYKYYNEDKALK